MNIMGRQASQKDLSVNCIHKENKLSKEKQCSLLALDRSSVYRKKLQVRTATKGTEVSESSGVCGNEVLSRPGGPESFAISQMAVKHTSSHFYLVCLEQGIEKTVEQASCEWRGLCKC